jgi:hypothetical protein
MIRSHINNYMKQYYAYELIDSLTDQVIYVGKGSGSRMYYHVKAVLNGTHVNVKLKNKINSIVSKGGSIKYNRIDLVDEASAFAKEVELIQIHRTLGTNLCNCTDGGEGISGHTFTKSEESKKKVSDKLKGIPKSNDHKISLKSAKKNNPNNSKYWLNKKFTEEHRQKLKESAQKRKNMSSETKHKISISGTWKELKGKSHEEIYGKEMADRMREKNRNSHLGKILSDQTKAKIARFAEQHPRALLYKCTNPSTDVFYCIGKHGLTELANHFKLKRFSFVFDTITKIAISKSHPGWTIEELGQYKNFPNVNYDFK